MLSLIFQIYFRSKCGFIRIQAGFSEVFTWEQRKLEDIADRYDNLRIPVAANLRIAGSTPYYGANGIQDYVDGYTHEGEFVLVAEDGANDLKNYPVKCVKGRIWVNNHAHVLQGKRDIADNLFLSFSLNQADIESLLVGGGRAKLNAETMMGIEMSLPKIEEQRQIGAYFAQLDDLITLHQRMCVSFGCTLQIRKDSPLAFAWEQRKLGEITSLITKGTTPIDKSKMGTVNFVKIESIDSSSGEITITTKISEDEHNGYLRRSQLQENDILFSIAGTLGRVTAVNKAILPANTNQALAIIRLKSECLSYITTYLKGKAVADFVKTNPTVGAQPNLSLEQVGSLGISLPSIEEQEKIGQYFHHLDALITLHQRKQKADINSVM